MVASVKSLSRSGNNLLARYSDGSTQFFTPTPTGAWIPGAHTFAGVSTGAGGGEDQTTPVTGGTPGTSAAPVDDYPWPNAPTEAMSPLRYSYRDCTDFAAWRINRDLGVTSAPWMYTWGQLRLTNGDAIGWRPDWQAHGWEVSSSPRAGMLGWFGSKAGTEGHINYVQAVRGDGSIHMEEYNWSPNHQAYNQRDASPSDPYFPDAFLGMPPKR